ncbi:hypothetical protein WJX72_008246 [[Myrmecia] bisecta]|uniref:ABC-2 type transporter transmembrane domain-containing protein n=1 Tax=[Myrmecia] bisecta TaxID=41462 RepID=A0AAW1R897_9CHLO
MSFFIGSGGVQDRKGIACTHACPQSLVASRSARAADRPPHRFILTPAFRAAFAGFYKHRANLFSRPGHAACPPRCCACLNSFVVSMVYSCMVYWVAGFAIRAGRFFTVKLILFLVHQMAIPRFCLMGAIGRMLVAATMLGSPLLLVVIVLGGFVLIKFDIPPWWIWEIAINKFTAGRWSFPVPYAVGETMGQIAQRNRGLFTEYYWVWLGVGVLLSVAARRASCPRSS